jgi:hypothetical protein
VTTLIREWGTRSGLQAVLQVGGQTNFGHSAEALLTQFDDAPQLIVIADGDGDPEAARQQITNDLFQRACSGKSPRRQGVATNTPSASRVRLAADFCFGELRMSNSKSSKDRRGPFSLSAPSTHRAGVRSWSAGQAMCRPREPQRV